MLIKSQLRLRLRLQLQLKLKSKPDFKVNSMRSRKRNHTISMRFSESKNILNNIINTTIAKIDWQSILTAFVNEIQVL